MFGNGSRQCLSLPFWDETFKGQSVIILKKSSLYDSFASKNRPVFRATLSNGRLALLQIVVKAASYSESTATLKSFVFAFLTYKANSIFSAVIYIVNAYFPYFCEIHERWRLYYFDHF